MEEPIATTDERIVRAVAEALQRQPDVVLLHRPAYTGGQKLWYMLRSMDDFERALSSGTCRSSFSAFLGPELPIRGIAGNGSLPSAEQLLRECGEILIARIGADRFTLDVDGFDAREYEYMAEFLAESRGLEIAMGRYPPFWRPNDAEAITAYVADKDGRVRPGSY